MGGGQAKESQQLFITYDWESNEYFQNCFQTNFGKTQQNMHFTVCNLMGKGFVPKDLQYEKDYSKKVQAEKEEMIIDTKEFKETLSDPDEIMYKLNMANWSYHMESFDGAYKYMIQDLDCLRISYRLKKFEEQQNVNQPGDDNKYNQLIFLPLSGITVNLETEEAYYDTRKKRFYRLVRDPENVHKRSWLSKKFIYQQLNFISNQQSYEEVRDSQLGYRWSIEVKGDIQRLPTMNLVFSGLTDYLIEFLRRKLEKSSKRWQEQCIGRYKTTLHYILDLVDYQNRDKPIKADELQNPQSKAACIILYIYSLDSPFTNEFAKQYQPPKDEKKMAEYKRLMKQIGPYDRCLQEILHNNCELNRFDRLDSSTEILTPKSYLLYKGCFMDMEKIEMWKEQARNGAKIRLPHTTNFTENFREALYSAKHVNKDKTIKSVLFVLAIFNEKDYPGFRLNNEKYSSYPDEEDVILPAGIQIEVEQYKMIIMGDKYVPKEGQVDCTEAKFHVFYMVRFG